MWLGEVISNYDIVARGPFQNAQELARYVKTEIPKIGGIVSTETIVLLTVRKWPGVWLPDENELPAQFRRR